MLVKKFYSRNGDLNTVLLKNFDKEIFSAGTHYKELRQLALKNDQKGFKRYLNSLQQMSFYTSCYDKPIIVNLTGTLENCSSVIFSNFPFAITTDKNLKFFFNSIDNNCTPLGGELFLLKNLPNKIGLYLALTGGELNLSDLMRFKLIHGFTEITEDTIEELKRYTYWEPGFKSFEMGNEYTNNYRINKKRDIEWSIEEFLERSKNENPEKVLLDLYYRKNIIEHANIRQRMKQQQKYQINNENDRKAVEIENNHLHYRNFLQKHLKFQQLEFEDSEIVENNNRIFRIFSKHNIEDILEELEMDGSEFAVKTYSNLINKDKKLLQVIVDMFRIAENKTFVECLEIEFSTLAKMFQNQQFRNNAFKKNQKLNLEDKFKVQVKDIDFILKKHRKDLLPIKEYYTEFPEAFLGYLNQTDLQNPYQCENYIEIVKANLFRIGVDYLNPTYDREEVKQKIGKFFTQQKNIDKKFQEFHDFINDKKMVQDHINSRKNALQKLLEQENFEDFLNKMIDQIQKENQKEEQNLVEKRMKELQRLELNKNMNQIKNFFVKTFMTKPNNKQIVNDDIIFENNNLLDIGSDRYQLSQRFKQKINFDQIKDKYSATHTINPNQLQNYINNKDLNIKSELIEDQNKNAVIDWSKQYIQRDSYITKKRKWRINIQLADYIYEKGLPETEKNYRLQMVQNLKDTFEKTCRVLNEEEQKEFEKIVLDTFFVDYSQYKDFRDLMNYALNNLLTFHKPVIGQKEVKLKSFKQQQIQSQEQIQFDEQKLEKLKDLIFIEKNEKLNNNNFLITCNSLKEYLISSEFLTETQKQQFQLLFSGDNKFIEEFQINCQKDFDKIINELIENKNKLVEDFENQLNFIQINYDLELRNYILSNVFYKNAKLFLNKIKNIYSKIKNKSDFQSIQQIQQIFDQHDIFKNSNNSIEDNFIYLDQQIKLCISLINQTKDLLTDKDLILDRQYDIIQEALKSIVHDSVNVQKMVKYIHHTILEQGDEQFMPDINFSHLYSITTTKEDIKNFLEKYQLTRRKSWNPIFNEIVTLYSDMIIQQKYIYEQKDDDKSIQDLANRYKKNVEQISDKLVQENIVIDYNPFENLLQFQDRINKKLEVINYNKDQEYEIANQFFYLDKQNFELNNTRYFNTTPPTIIQMEKLSKRLAHKGSSAIDLYLQNSQGQYLEIIHESADQWVLNELKNLLKQIFKRRRQIESRYTQDQLINLDLQISGILNKKHIGNLLLESFNNYNQQMNDLQKQVQEFYYKDNANKNDIKQKINDIDNFDPIKDQEYYKLLFSLTMTMMNNENVQDFDYKQIENDFIDLINNPKRFMRKRKLWQVKEQAMVESDKPHQHVGGNREHNDYSDLYSHASQIMYDKYQRVVFKDDFKSSNDILHRLNKKAEIVLNN